MKIKNIILILIALTVFFLMSNSLVNPFFNQTYNYAVSGLSITTTRGLLLLIFILSTIGIAIKFLR